MNASWMLVGLVYMMCIMYVVAAAESLTQENRGEDTEEQHQTCLLIVSQNYIQVIVFHLLAQTKVIYLHIYEPINKVSWEYTQEYKCQ